MPPNDPSVDHDDDQDMPDDEDHEASAERPAPTGASVLPFARRDRLDSILRMELGEQLYALIIEAGFRPATMRDIQANGRLVHIWICMMCDMYNLMRHVVGAMNLVTRLRRIVARYRHG